MKKVYLLAIGTLMATATWAQKAATKDNVGIGTNSPDPSAVLDIQSVNKGLLIPRLTVDQRNSIASPASGLMVYQTNEKSGFYFYDGNNWKPMTGDEAKSVATLDINGWALDGNATATANKAAATAASFIGTPAGVPINFKIGGVTAGKITTDNIFLGYQSGLSSGSGTTNLGFGNLSLAELTTGGSNTAIGVGTLRRTTSGNLNMSVGSLGLNFNTTGSANIALGHASLHKNTSGSNNIAIGKDALFNSNGDFNISIGATSFVGLTNGNRNVAIGYLAGSANISGSSNVFLGYAAGQNETGSNKLYITNSNTANPLLKGEFDNKNLKINTGATTSTTVGFLAVGNFDAAFTMPTANSYRLIVQDGIITEKVKVALRTTADWADYVFEPEYQKKMMSLEQVEKFAKENKHLPNVPSAQQLKDNGMDVGETSKMFMEKIEELTLYMIELNKEIKALKAENEVLKRK